ncbi:MAG: hypothetical protein ACODAU_02225 [Myxococcota bacterium]
MAQPGDHLSHDTSAHEPSRHTRPSTQGRGTRALLGLLAFLPLALVVAAGVFASTPEGGAGTMLYGAVLLMFLLVLFFGAFVINNRRIPGQHKVGWAASFLLIGPVTIPLYWYIHVWHAPHRGFDP